MTYLRTHSVGQANVHISKETHSHLAICLKNNEEQIIQSWQERIRRELPDSAEAEISEPKIPLTNLVKGLARDLADRSQTSAKLVRRHATECAAKPGYSLTQVLMQYDVLRSVVVETLSNGRPLSE